MQRFRRHLSYANVVATIALVVAMAGGAYAVNQTGTRDVKNNSLRSADLKNRKAVTARDVKRNSLGGTEVRESRLNPGPLVRVEGSEGTFCDLDESSVVSCVQTTISLPRQMNLLINATGGFASGSTAASANCEIRVDGRPRTSFLNPGETGQANTSSAATDGFGSTYVPSEKLDRGEHTVELVCLQIGTAEATVQDPSIAVIAVAAP